MKALLVSALLAAIGAGVAYRWFPVADSLGRYPAAWSRDEAIGKAQTLAARYGRDVADWKSWIQANRNARTYEFLRTAPDHPMMRVPQPWTYLVVFTRGPFRVRVEFGADGTPVEYSFRDGRRPEFPGRELGIAQETQVLQDFAGAEIAQYRKIGSVNRGAQGHVATWEWRDEDQPELIQQLEIASAPDGIRRVVMRSELSSAFVQRWVGSFGSAGFRFIATPVLTFAGITLINALFFAGLARGHIRLKQALRLFAGMFVIWAAGFIWGPDFERLLIAANAASQPPPERFLPAIGVAAALSALFAAMWAVGRALMRTAGLSRWRNFDALVGGAWWRREVGGAIASGLLLGAALTAVPVVLCAAKLFARSDATLTNPSWLASAVPAMLPLGFLPLWDFSAVFFLLVPLASTSYGQRWAPARLRWPLVAVLSVVLVGLVTEPLLDPVGNYVTAALLLAGFFAIYHFLDLLAVTMAGVGFSAVLVAIYFMNQQSAALRTEGAWTAAVYLMVALAGGAALLWAPKVDAAPEEEVVEIAAEREVLQSEFAMAREAQQRLLPTIPERLDGFSLAASCHPARDVGGDLYDFFRFPDGTYGLCVADVSGKGVPAALYMTMTKGILAAASLDPADLPGLAAALNTQLYAAGRKKTFVTMALGRLDVTSRKLEYLRAGHNSILWRRAGAKTCEYRKPRGVGLGLTTSRLFDRSIEVETLDLDSGDFVVFYSDGITEAMNGSLELFGEDRLKEVVERSSDLDAAALERAILLSVREFMGPEPPHDDMTLLVIGA